MLKSLSTQFAATLFFGPLGLAYTSVAAAVFLTLVLAVLFFTELGILSLFLVWPLAIIVGLVFVKLHNDQVRSSGSRLLLGPGEEPDFVSSVSSWARGVAVLGLILVGGYIAYLYLPDGSKQSVDNTASKLGRIVPSGLSAENDAGTENSSQQQADTVAANTETVTDGQTNGNAAVIAANSSDNNGDDNFSVIALPQREVATVIIDSDGTVQQGEEGSALNSGQPELTVDAPLVNLRRGPGTSFDIVTTVQAGDRLFEFARDGNWINVETASTGASGWIYSRLVR
jgi:hypothetical protein